MNIVPDTDAIRLHETIKDIITEAIGLMDHLEDAYQAQWSGISVDPTDSANHADPTGNVAVDPQRLAIRELVITAERRLRDLHDEIVSASDALAAI